METPLNFFSTLSGLQIFGGILATCGIILLPILLIHTYKNVDSLFPKDKRNIAPNKEEKAKQTH